MRVRVGFGEEELEVEIVDEGSGNGDGPGSRAGLAGIRERVAVFGGRFESGPRSGGGWLLCAAFPLAR